MCLLRQDFQVLRALRNYDPPRLTRRWEVSPGVQPEPCLGGARDGVPAFQQRHRYPEEDASAGQRRSGRRFRSAAVSEDAFALDRPARSS